MKTNLSLLAGALAAATALGGGLAAAALPSADPAPSALQNAENHGQPGRDRLTPEATLFQDVTRSTRWDLADTVDLDFDAFHMQGMSLVGDRIFVSSVEIIEPTVRYEEPIDGYDRSAGQGIGHVFVLDREGNLLEDIVLGEGDIYHPGGIDFDGEKLWVPVAEYRPDSASIVYTIDPDTHEVTEEFRHDDHVGGVVRNRSNGQVNGVSWGSRTLFTWNRHGKLKSTSANPSHFVDYQDCEYSGSGHQLCSGVSGALGGLALTDLKTNEIVNEVPVTLTSETGKPITQNPVSLEADGDVLRMLAAPDDGPGTKLYLYEARP